MENNTEKDTQRLTVDWLVHESITARMERSNERMAIIAGLLLAAVIVTNLLWVIFT